MRSFYPSWAPVMLDLSKEVKEDIGAGLEHGDAPGWFHLGLFVRFDHQFANSPFHSGAAWACFLLADAWLALFAVFSCMMRPVTTVCRYGWVDLSAVVEAIPVLLST
ncbi:hypothetical protein ABZP36_012925 [Zizania latifolia]